MNLQMGSNAVIETNLYSYIEPMKWPNKRLAEWHESPALSLDEIGVIQDCSKSCEFLFGYQRGELVLQHVSKLIPLISGVELIKEGRFTPLFIHLCHCGHIFHAQNRQGDTFSCNLSSFHLEHDGGRTLRLIVNPLGKDDE